MNINTGLYVTPASAIYADLPFLTAKDVNILTTVQFVPQDMVSMDLQLNVLSVATISLTAIDAIATLRVVHNVKVDTCLLITTPTAHFVTSLCRTALVATLNLSAGDATRPFMLLIKVLFLISASFVT